MARGFHWNDAPPAVKSQVATFVAGLEERVLTDRHFGVLNLCRVLAYVREGRVTSKVQGGAWALGVLPMELRPVVAAALALYQGEPGANTVEERELRRFVEGMQRLIATAASGHGPNPSLTTTQPDTLMARFAISGEYPRR